MCQQYFASDGSWSKSVCTFSIMCDGLPKFRPSTLVPLRGEAEE